MLSPRLEGPRLEGSLDAKLFIFLVGHQSFVKHQTDSSASGTASPAPQVMREHPDPDWPWNKKWRYPDRSPKTKWGKPRGPQPWGPGKILGAIGLFLSVTLPLIRRGHEKKGTFTANQDEDSTSENPYAPTAMVQVYRKYDVPVPAHLEWLHRDKNVSVNDFPTPFDAQYLCPITFGENQTMMMVMDTGSSASWVFSDLMPPASQEGHTVFNPYNSTSFEPLTNVTWDIEYGGNGSAKGKVGRETVSIGGTEVGKQTIEVAETVSDGFISDNLDGVIGLAFGPTGQNSSSSSSKLPFFADIKPEISLPLFTVDLKKNEPGSFDFGFIDETKYQAPLKYTPVDTSEGHWKFNISGYQIGDHPINQTSRAGIADTGTSLLMLDHEIVDDYYRQVQDARYESKSGGWTYPCDVPIPDFTFLVDEYRGTIPGDFLTYGLATHNGTRCFGGIQEQLKTFPFNIWGQIMFRAQFVVFDGGKQPQLGFAPKSITNSSVEDTEVVVVSTKKETSTVDDLLEKLSNAINTTEDGEPL
ncbi:MAG: hypothetical protein M1823_003369 [Watsoniomyces obsoletus]|nr:MAG: hypothetical protein M1823_003369 [Watsoniomyces obsoletus]